MKDDNETFDGGNQMVFTYGDPYASEENQIDVLKSFMGQFAGGKEVKFDLYPLTRLFYALQKELAARGRCDDIPNENFSNVFLSRDPYEVIGGISCQVKFKVFHSDFAFQLIHQIIRFSTTKKSMQRVIVLSAVFVAGHFYWLTISVNV